MVYEERRCDENDEALCETLKVIASELGEASGDAYRTYADSRIMINWMVSRETNGVRLPARIEVSLVLAGDTDLVFRVTDYWKQLRGRVEYFRPGVWVTYVTNVLHKQARAKITERENALLKREEEKRAQWEQSRYGPIDDAYLFPELANH